MPVVMSFASNLKSNDDDNAILQYYMYLILQSVLDGWLEEADGARDSAGELRDMADEFSDEIQRHVVGVVIIILDVGKEMVSFWQF